MASQLSLKLTTAAVGMTLTFGSSSASNAMSKNQCMKTWNIINGRLAETKDLVSKEFKDSIKSAFLVTDGNNALVLKNQKPINTCDKISGSQVREISIKKVEDMVLWQRLQDNGKTYNLPIRENFRVVISKDAEQIVIDRQARKLQP